MDSRDLRQLENMRQQITFYRNSSIQLSVLIGDLVFLRDALSRIPEDLEREFNDHVLDLESAYSYALEKNDGNLDSMTKKVVDAALPKLLDIIDRLQDDLA